MHTEFEAVATLTKKRTGNYVEVISKSGFTLSADNGSCHFLGSSAPSAFHLHEGTTYHVTVTDDESLLSNSKMTHSYSAEARCINSDEHAFWTDGVSLMDKTKTLQLGTTYYLLVSVVK